jgi:hypothetical protein
MPFARNAPLVLECCSLALALLVVMVTLAQERTTDPPANAPPSKAAKPADQPEDQPEPLPPPPNLPRMTEDFDIWIDQERKRVIVDGSIALRQGSLEMFACPKNTKEHESIVAVNCKARYVHAGLLAVGAEAGRPVQFDPEYKPATGPEVEVTVAWRDKKGEHRARAQDWIQDAKTGKAMEFPFVFAGSGFFVDDTTGEKHYLGDAGDFICVSNFTSATLDLPVESSQQNTSLNFRAFSERIPPIGTPVRLVLAPKLKAKPADARTNAGQPTESPKKSGDSSK